MPSLELLNRCGREEFVAALGRLFEHSPWVAEEAFAARPFRDSAHLLSELCAAMRRAGRERQAELIRAHPDLAGRLARSGLLTAESAREQAIAGLGGISREEEVRMDELNALYRGKFGWPFVICARLNDKEAILRAMSERLGHSAEQEREAALREIEKIAGLRLADALSSP